MRPSGSGRAHVCWTCVNNVGFGRVFGKGDGVGALIPVIMPKLRFGSVLTARTGRGRSSRKQKSIFGVGGERKQNAHRLVHAYFEVTFLRLQVGVPCRANLASEENYLCLPIFQMRKKAR